MSVASAAEVIAVDGTRRFFRCPGCGNAHFTTDTWTWNGDLVKPTFAPSILVEGHRFKRDGSGSEAFRCHSYVVDGQIQFLGDCTHALAGKTVPLPAWGEGGA